MERGSGYTARCRSPWGAQVPRATVGGAPTQPGPGPARLGSAPPGWAWQRLSPQKPRAGRERRRGASPGPLLPARRRREPPARALPAGAGAGGTCRAHRHSLHSGAPAPPPAPAFPAGRGQAGAGSSIPAAAARGSWSAGERAAGKGRPPGLPAGVRQRRPGAA